MLFLRIICSTSIAEDMLKSVNESRVNGGLSTLTKHDALQRASEYQANVLCLLGRLTHEGMDPSHTKLDDRLRAYDFVGENIGENIAKQQDDDYQEVLKLWVNSAEHRKNIFGDYNFTGVSSCKDKKGNRYWVQVFGKGKKRETDQLKSFLDQVESLLRSNPVLAREFTKVDKNESGSQNENPQSKDSLNRENENRNDKNNLQEGNNNSSEGYTADMKPQEVENINDTPKSKNDPPKSKNDFSVNYPINTKSEEIKDPIPAKENKKDPFNKNVEGPQNNFKTPTDSELNSNNNLDFNFPSTKNNAEQKNTKNFEIDSPKYKNQNANEPNFPQAEGNFFDQNKSQNSSFNPKNDVNSATNNKNDPTKSINDTNKRNQPDPSQNKSTPQENRANFQNDPTKSMNDSTQRNQPDPSQNKSIPQEIGSNFQNDATKSINGTTQRNQPDPSQNKSTPQENRSNFQNDTNAYANNSGKYPRQQEFNKNDQSTAPNYDFNKKQDSPPQSNYPNNQNPSSQKNSQTKKLPQNLKEKIVNFITNTFEDYLNRNQEVKWKDLLPSEKIEKFGETEFKKEENKNLAGKVEIDEPVSFGSNFKK